MGKEITLRRAELVWQSREVVWTEKDWQNLKNWLKGNIEKDSDGGYWKNNYSKMYDLIKDMSWEDAYQQFVNWYNDDIANCLYVEEKTSWGDGTYKHYVGEFIQDQIREDVYDADVDSEDYADDYEEEYLFEDVKDEEDND